MKGQISEEFARKLVNTLISFDDCDGKEHKDKMIKLWKEKGYIKQSSLDEIENRINEPVNQVYRHAKTMEICRMILQTIKELQDKIEE